ncbi:bifunctional 4-hydroxy-2-oxoglutarate aldolase/2-dehydro-3-deoxy-phosphogluconate aldolase [Subtercola boreus]|uniref:bifunctional 4-hydroxy-2-oxoglutarate aldolase/2-dehydro-3-deoxy-phosphogluconate aldolase n=1 Tax=Subtercola boreus TaxID=120213 RepID=UPI00209C3779|nr:bifunctional 4-hydroxy-2-oxoglutarate aldolase/2-dehydro-3-deoxy-phosphogluconate aldolase [Subtercola boreus]
MVVIDNAARTAELVSALLAGGIGCAEIALRTPGALLAIESAARIPGFRIGAGTVLSAEDVDRAVDAGAQFVVSPGLDDEVIERCAHHGVPLVPGVATATEVQRALRSGLEYLKFFPAEASGGRAAIEQLAGPFPSVQFLPSGGVSRENVASYASSDAVFAVSGSWMASRRMIADGDFETIAELSREATKLVTQLSPAS